MSVYQWTTDHDEMALDTTTVGILEDSPALFDTALTPVELPAFSHRPDWINQGDKIKAAVEPPLLGAAGIESSR